jgi:hypothetical protein
MKVFVSLTVCFLICFGCKITAYNSEVVATRRVETGVFILNANGYHKKSHLSIIEAEKNAFNVVLFRGLPGTDLAIPLIANESDIRSKNEAFFNDFFDKGGYRNFIMGKSTNVSTKKIKRTQVVFNITATSLG